MMEENYEKVYLAGVCETAVKGAEEAFPHSMEELYELARACRMEPMGVLTQMLDKANNATYLGPGKVLELKEIAGRTEASLIIFNDTLTPSQLRNLQDALQMAVMDRTALILEIFRKRARSREAKGQVELASLKYLKPRLMGLGKAMTRQGGTSGSQSSRGEGETKLELDRRRIDHRISELQHELKEIETERLTQRKKRQNSRLPLAALVGYTNAGKSTIMNGLVERYCGDEAKKVFEADMLFATLDTTVRKIETDNNRDFLLSDTVGFIHKLPTGLIEAFKSTLEEAKEADVILHVVDCSDEHFREHMITTRDTLRELDAAHIPEIVIYNKADLCEDGREYPKVISKENGTEIYISARDGASLEALVKVITELLYGDYAEAEFLIPYDKGAEVSYLMQKAQILSTEYEAEGTRVRARCHEADIGRLRKYII